MSRLATGDLEGALTLLNERLALSGAPPISLLVCGGTALRALGLVVRTTQDVDVLAIIEHDGGTSPKLRKARPLPQPLLEAVQAVAEDLSLPLWWLNAEPTDLLDFGLPMGCLDRATPRSYGSHLSTYFIGRIDQIHFKLYAAVDSGDIHVADLLALQPTEDELLAAVTWARTHDPSLGFHSVLASFLRQIGHAQLAEKV